MYVPLSVWVSYSSPLKQTGMGSRAILLRISIIKALLCIFVARKHILLPIHIFRWIDFTQFGIVFVHNGQLGRIGCLLSEWSEKKLLLMETMDPSQPHSSRAHGLKICSNRHSLTAAEFTVCWNVARVRLVWAFKGRAGCVAAHAVYTNQLCYIQFQHSYAFFLLTTENK